MQENRSESEKTFARKVAVAAGIVLLFVAVFLVLKAAFNVLLLILAGVLIAVYFRGLGEWTARKLHWSEAKGVWLVTGTTLAAVALIVLLLGSKVSAQMTGIGKTLPSSAQQFRSRLSQSQLGRQLLNATGNIQQKSPEKQKLLRKAGKFFRTTFGIVGDIYIILFVGIFFTVQSRLYKDAVLALVPAKRRHRGSEIMDRMGHTLRDWLAGKLFAMVVVAVLTGAGLAIIGIPMPLGLALIAGLLNFVPNFGPLIAMIPAVLIASSQGTTVALAVAGLYVAIQIAESNFITPLVQKRLIQIPPAFIIIGQVTMGVLTGGLGVILATPVLAILMVLIQELYVSEIES